MTHANPGRTGLMRTPCACPADHPELIAERSALVGDCWEWQLSLDRDGYGRITHNKTTWQAHRFVYASLVGEVPEGLVFDHLCRNRRCVNPDHVEPVTDRTNTLRIPTLLRHLAGLCGAPRRSREPGPLVHGAGGYTNRGCRCEVCTAANTARCRDYRRRYGRKKRAA